MIINSHRHQSSIPLILAVLSILVLGLIPMLGKKNLNILVKNRFDINNGLCGV